jgi:uncharacterized protein (DUF362 family)
MKVAIVDNVVYTNDTYFSPGCDYPEYPFDSCREKDLNSKKSALPDAYSAVRSLFFHLEMDAKHFGENCWNPLGGMIKKGDSVVIKPNWVFHKSPPRAWAAMATHGSITRAILDYVFIALNKRGSVTIGDAPIQGCDFPKILLRSGVSRILDFYAEHSDLAVRAVDFRTEGLIPQRLGHFRKQVYQGDPLGYTTVDLKDASEHFDSQALERYRVDNYDKARMIEHHSDRSHEYSIANSVLRADAIINVPKLKTHRLAGMTCCLKNVVGAFASKAALPHYAMGAVECGGNEYQCESFRKRLISKMREGMNASHPALQVAISRNLSLLLARTGTVLRFKDPYLNGAWYGNDTISRTIVDLNKILYHADKNGALKKNVQRKIFNIVDAVTAGQGEAPLSPQPIECGLVIGGVNPLAIDVVCSTLMGFDYRKIPTLTCALDSKQYDLLDESIDQIEITSSKCSNRDEIYDNYGKRFIPSAGWKGHIADQGG